MTFDEGIRSRWSSLLPSAGLSIRLLFALAAAAFVTVAGCAKGEVRTPPEEDAAGGADYPGTGEVDSGERSAVTRSDTGRADAGVPVRCTPGATRSCRCPSSSGGGTGSQTCVSDGTGWSECRCDEGASSRDAGMTEDTRQTDTSTEDTSKPGSGTCAPTSCMEQGAECGPVPDGCGGTINCGSCESGKTCTDNVCTCRPRTCTEAGVECGSLADGCGGKIDCGSCSGTMETCGNSNRCVRTGHRLFVTSKRYTGKIGGLSGGDAKCNALAQNAGLTGQWRAILSTSSTPANQHIDINGRVYNLNKKKLASGSSDFWRGNFSTVAVTNEHGRSASATPWTGTNMDGTTDANTCRGWTTDSTAYAGSHGSTNYPNPYLIDRGAYSCSCSYTYPIYCIDGQVP